MVDGDMSAPPEPTARGARGRFPFLLRRKRIPVWGIDSQADVRLYRR